MKAKHRMMKARMLSFNMSEEATTKILLVGFLLMLAMVGVQIFDLTGMN